MPNETAEIIDQGVRENALAVLTLQDGAEWITYKSRFLERDPGRKFIVLDYQDTHGAPPPPLAPGQFVGLSFRHKSRKIMFATVVEARGKFVVESGGSIAAVRYRWPETLTELQRRAYYRTPVPPSTQLVVSVWAGGAAARDAAQARPLAVVTGQACDLSCGGTLVKLSRPAPPSWPDNQTVGIELQLPDGRPPVVVDGHYRGARHDADESLCLAVQFVGLELAVEGRAVLQRIARCLQKFHRLTLAGELRGGDARFRNF